MTLPDWLVERARLGEIGKASGRRLDGCDAELAEQFDALAERDAAELRTHPPGPAVAQIQARVAREQARRARRRRVQATALATVVGVAVVVLVATRTNGRTTSAAVALHEVTAPSIDDAPESTRVKGSMQLAAFRKVGERVERLDAGATVREGDLIQLRYNAGGRTYGLIASIDGAGAVTLHFPETDRASTALAARATDLPHAYALDDAPRFERFFFITDEEPIDVAGALDRLRSLAHRGDGDSAALELPARFRQLSLFLRKAPAR